MFGVSTVVGNTTSENRDDIYTLRLTTRYTGTTSRAKFQSFSLRTPPLAAITSAIDDQGVRTYAMTGKMSFIKVRARLVDHTLSFMHPAVVSVVLAETVHFQRLCVGHKVHQWKTGRRKT